MIKDENDKKMKSKISLDEILECDLIKRSPKR